VVAFVGRLAPYKGLLELLTAFRGHPDPAARLVIAGAPFDATFVRTVQHLAERDRRVTVHAHFVADADLQTYLRAADLVALPFRSILNSGSAMLALSFDRPVLVPDYGAMPELRADAGERWVHTYRGDVIQTEDLTSALSAAGGLPDRTDGSHLAAFDPDRVASATCRAFRAFRAFRGE
jgi:glycosyltransferase involved in cell wall biosynthesis